MNLIKSNNEIIKWLENEVGIKPKRISLYIEALTHKSFSNENKKDYDYEKMEFLGDSILSYLTAIFLYEKMSTGRVGKITETKSLLVQAKTLVKAAKDIGISKYVMLGASFKKNDEISKILEDTFESLIAAIYLDQGIDSVKVLLERTIFKYYLSKELNEFTDYKSMIQVAMSKHNKGGVIYTHKILEKNIIEAELFSNKIKYGVGYGKNKKEAEKQAAKDAYSKLIKEENSDGIFKKI